MAGSARVVGKLPNPLVPCKKCSQTGVVPMRTQTICSSDDGVTVGFVEGYCPRCKGSGWVRP